MITARTITAWRRLPASGRRSVVKALRLMRYDAEFEAKTSPYPSMRRMAGRKAVAYLAAIAALTKTKAATPRKVRRE